jgi:subtilisin family serine protease
VVPAGIERIQADKDPSSRGAGVKVAVIDTGIDHKHPDLKANYKGGYDFVNEDDDPMDDNGHGTHCAGTIAALDNDIGVIGVAPEADLYGVKVLNQDGSGYNSDIIRGIIWSIHNDMDVISMSLGGPGPSRAMDMAIALAVDAGVTVVVAAGNESQDANYVTPASSEHAITVSAIADFDGQPGGMDPQVHSFGPIEIVEEDDYFASFSNYGSVVDIAAPGVSILSTWPGGGYKELDGTSMACPHVAGAAALYVGSRGNDTPTPAEVMEALMNNAVAQDAPAGFDGDPDDYDEPLLNVLGL